MKARRRKELLLSFYWVSVVLVLTIWIRGSYADTENSINIIDELDNNNFQIKNEEEKIGDENKKNGQKGDDTDNDEMKNNEEAHSDPKGVLSTNVQDIFPPRAFLLQQRDERLLGCNCSSQQCCYYDDKPFCCPKSKKCCGNTCCASFGICCRSKTTAGLANCCPQGTICSNSGECSSFLNGKSWYHVPFILGVLLVCLITCSLSCMCYSRMQQRRRQILAAQLALRLATMNPSLPIEDSVSTGVPRRVIDNLPIQQYKPGCMPAENALCSICLNDYEEDDELRTLPCKHLFHSKCIDRWLANHTTCPLCIQPVVASES